ncbi:MAG TPA: MoxR family ATPase [Vicinamibacterales bacterium]|jgi:MoxR-like ATPase
MEFTREYFDPVKKKGGEPFGADGSVVFRAGRQPGDVYVYRPEVILALNVAIAVRRPLLISGEPGSGKSTLAQNVAAVLGWRYYKHMITSRTQGSELLWRFDTLQRLNDANAKKKELRLDQAYVEPGTLWWAFDPQTAVHRGKNKLRAAADRAVDPWQGEARDPAIVLLDEIDKADPDVPNDLLEAFDLRAFTVRETGDRIQASATRQVLLVLTTNGERELPPAFMRRCVTLVLRLKAEEEVDWFVQIARRRDPKIEEPLAREIAQEVSKLRQHARNDALRPPGTAEYLDALNACRELNVRIGTPAWKQIEQNVLWKRDRPIPTTPAPAA